MSYTVETTSINGTTSRTTGLSSGTACVLLSKGLRDLTQGFTALTNPSGSVFDFLMPNAQLLELTLTKTTLAAAPIGSQLLLPINSVWQRARVIGDGTGATLTTDGILLPSTQPASQLLSTSHESDSIPVGSLVQRLGTSSDSSTELWILAGDYSGSGGMWFASSQSTLASMSSGSYAAVLLPGNASIADWRTKYQIIQVP